MQATTETSPFRRLGPDVLEVRGGPGCRTVIGLVTALTGAAIQGVTAHGKWLQVQTTQGWLLLNLGMGGEILLVEADHLPEKRRLVFAFHDSSCLSINFWWFGYAHYAQDPAAHPMVGKLGPHAMDLTLAQFQALLAGRRGSVKAFLLDQERIAGIGNVYVQDPLFKARIHPLRAIPSLSDAESATLWQALRETLRESIDHGGAAFEVNLYGKRGGWDESFFLVAYREGLPCPNCSTPVAKIRTGSTAGYICPTCQRLP